MSKPQKNKFSHDIAACNRRPNFRNKSLWLVNVIVYCRNAGDYSRKLIGFVYALRSIMKCLRACCRSFETFRYSTVCSTCISDEATLPAFLVLIQCRHRHVRQNYFKWFKSNGMAKNRKCKRGSSSALTLRNRVSIRLWKKPWSETLANSLLKRKQFSTLGAMHMSLKGINCKNCCLINLKLTKTWP